jgi:hypothetical protein
MDITTTMLSGVLRAQDFQASMTKKADAVELLTGSLMGSGAAGATDGAVDPLYQSVLQSSLFAGGGAAGVKLLAAQDAGIGQHVDVQA